MPVPPWQWIIYAPKQPRKPETVGQVVARGIQLTRPWADPHDVAAERMAAQAWLMLREDPTGIGLAPLVCRVTRGDGERPGYACGRDLLLLLRANVRTAG